MAMDSLLYPSLLLLPVDSGKLSSLVIDGALGRPLTSSALCKPNPTSPKVSLSLAPTSGEDLWNRVPFDESDSGVINAMENDETQWNRLYCDLFLLKDVRSDRDLYAMSASSSSSVAVQSLLPYSKQSQEDPEKEKDFHVNVGYAIRTLREELPNMFYKELTYEIYRQDIIFYDPMNTVSGVENYKLIFKALRFYGRIFFKSMWVQILRIWQPSDNVIMVRWQVRGVPRVPWEAQGIFDGTSEYKLDKKGKIYEHKVDNIALNSRPKLKVPTVEELLQMAGCPSTPKPTYFQEKHNVFTGLMPYLFQFTWVRYYLALKGTVGLYTQHHLSI